MFWDGFEKRAAGTPAGILEPVTGISGALFGRSQAARETAAARARGWREEADVAAKHRKENFLQYLANPEVSGPISEGVARLEARHNEASVKSPVLSSLIPGYGVIRGKKG